MVFYLKRKSNKPITISVTSSLTLLLVFAQKKGFFAEQNVNIKFVSVPFGRRGLEMLINHQVDIGTLIGGNIAYLGLLGGDEPFKCFASIQQSVPDRLLCRLENEDDKKRLSDPLFWRGKRIGFQPRTSSHLFLMKFLENKKIPKQYIKLKVLQPNAMSGALARHDVDGVSVWQPHAYYTEAMLTDLGIPYHVFKNNSLYRENVVLCARKTFLIQREKELSRILLALKMAEDYIQNNQEEAQNVFAQVIKLPVALLRNTWEEYSPVLTPVSCDVLSGVKELGAWMIKNDTQFYHKPLPDYDDFVGRYPLDRK